MAHESIEDAIGRVLHGNRLKAQEIALRLSAEGRSIDKTGVNSALYRVQASGRFLFHSDATWTVSEDSGSRSSTGTSRRAAPIARPASEVQMNHDGTIESDDLTPEQRRVVEFSPNGNLLVRGEAGSGKTTVLAIRASKMQGLFGNGRLLFLTYNAALASYVQRLLQDHSANGNVHVQTFDQWSQAFYRAVSGRSVSVIYKDDERRALINAAIRSQPTPGVRHRLLDAPIEFWDEEINWIYGQGVRTAENYRTVQRSGRGTAVQVRGDDRDVVWRVFEQYDRSLRTQRRYDHANLAGAIWDAVAERGGVFPAEQQFDHIFVDEVQDFNLSWLAVLTPVAKSSLNLAGDLAQRIYRRNFTWKEAGIEIHGSRSIALKGSHRTTKQIMQVAVHLATNPDLQSDADYLAPTIPEKVGPKVVKIVRSRFEDAQRDAAKHAVGLANSRPRESVVLAAQFNRKVEALARLARDLGCQNVQIAKREELAAVRSGLVVTTFHQLKGLEFDHLVLTDLEDATMPQFWINKSSADEQAAESEAYLRRLVYMAMTRARRSLTLAGASPFSRFFDAVPGELFENR